MKKEIYNLRLTRDEQNILLSLLNGNNEELFEKVLNLEKIEISYKKRTATQKATEVRSKKAREKIQNAINLLHLENKEITHNSIAITGGVSYNTVKKYIPDIDRVGDF